MVSRKFASIITIILIGLSTATAPLAASDKAMASISGSVVDTRGGAVARARITAINDARGLQRQVTTNEEGCFEIPFLPAGTYTLMAEMPGFATIRVTDLEAQANINRRLMITLQPRGAQETITVKAPLVTVEAGETSPKHSITREQTETHPVIASNSGRNIIDTLPLLVPGVSPWLDVGPRGESLSVNGGRPLVNVFLLNGGDNNDAELSIASSPFPNPDALQEVIIATNNFKADLGGAGGVINVITREGRDRFHGSFRHLFSHEALNARGFFDRYKYPNRLNTFGGQIEGPFRLPGLYEGKDRTRFFFDAEGNRSRFDYFSYVDVLPLKERSGDFSDYPLPDPDRSDFPHQPIDPLTGQPFPGGKIPADRIAPLARIYLDRFIPLPNLDDRYFQRPARYILAYGQATARFDHKLTESSALSATYFFNSVGNDNSTYRLPEGVETFRRKDQNFVLSHTHSFSVRSINQATVSLSRSALSRRLDQPGFTNLDPRKVGFDIRPQTENYLSLPSVFIDGIRYRANRHSASLSSVYAEIGDRYGRPTDAFKTTFSVRNDFTRVAGSHTLGFGGGARAFIFNRYVPNNSGLFYFSDNNTGGTGLGIADFLLGLPLQYEQTTGNIQYQRHRAYFIYAMDDWKARPNLSISLGLRYEIAPPATDKLDQVAVFRPGHRSKKFPRSPIGLLFPGDPDPLLGVVPRGGYRTDFNNLAPRIGIAYRVEARRGWLGRIFGNNKSVIRAGFGMFYSPTFGAHLSEFSYQEPFSTSVILHADSLFGPPIGTLANPFGSAVNPFPIDLKNRSTEFVSRLHTFDPAFRTAYTYHYSLSIQRELSGRVRLELAYVGNNSFHTDRERELNDEIPDPFNPYYPRRRYEDFDSILSQESTGRARYDSFQLRVSKRFDTGLSFDGFYTFSKGLDNASGPFTAFHSTGGYGPAQPGATNPFDWARSSFDRRHNFVLSYFYDLPLKKGEGLRGWLTSGWRAGGVTQIRSGTPLDIHTGYYQAKAYLGRPDLIGDYKRLDPKEERTFIINGEPVTGHFFFDPRTFRVSFDSEGNLGRNVFDGPRVSLTSVSLAKRTSFFKSHEVEIRADILNLFNQVNFQPPVQAAGSPYFGQVYYTLPPRRIQLSLRYRF
ncbi:MAG: carboxypeptidase regulatory-like domain-containing protein [Acidobacteriota bacterium]